MCREVVTQFEILVFLSARSFSNAQIYSDLLERTTHVRKLIESKPHAMDQNLTICKTALIRLCKQEANVATVLPRLAKTCEKLSVLNEDCKTRKVKPKNSTVDDPLCFDSVDFLILSTMCECMSSYLAAT